MRRPFPSTLFFSLLAGLLVWNDNDFFQLSDLIPSGPFFLHHEHFVVAFVALALWFSRR